MAYQIEWKVENLIVQLKFFDEVVMDEVIRFHQEWSSFIDQGTPPVHAVLDASRVTKHPLDLPKVLKNSTAFNHPNLGWVLLYGASTSANLIVSVVAQFSKRKFRTIADLEAALTFLATVDDRIAQANINSET